NNTIFLFFQADDGIRDRNVTGVQTCALPISASSSSVPPARTLVAARTEPSSARTITDRPPGAEASTRASPVAGRLQIADWSSSEIGRPACRERVERGGGAASLTREQQNARGS